MKTFILIMILTGYGPTVTMDTVQDMSELDCNLAASSFMIEMLNQKDLAITGHAYCIPGRTIKDE